MRNQQRDPRQESEDGGQIDKVAKHRLCVICSIHKSSAAEECGDGQSGNRYTTLVGPLEDLGGMALDGQSVDGTGGNVQVRVGSAEGEEQNGGIDNGGKVRNLGELDGNDKGRGRSTGGGLVSECQVRGVVGNKHSQEEDGKAVEEQDPVEGKLDGARDSLAWVLGLANSDSDELSSKVGKNGVDQRAPETVEFACTA